MNIPVRPGKSCHSPKKKSVVLTNFVPPKHNHPSILLSSSGIFTAVFPKETKFWLMKGILKYNISPSNTTLLAKQQEPELKLPSQIPILTLYNCFLLKRTKNFLENALFPVTSSCSDKCDKSILLSQNSSQQRFRAWQIHENACTKLQNMYYEDNHTHSQ